MKINDEDCCFAVVVCAEVACAVVVFCIVNVWGSTSGCVASVNIDFAFKYTLLTTLKLFTIFKCILS